MAPSAESSNAEEMESSTTYPQYAPQSLSAMTPSKNVAFAVNYELPMVDQFLSVHRDSRRKSILRRARVESPTNSTQENHSHYSLTTIAEANTTSATIASLFASSGINRIQSDLENDTPNISAEHTLLEASKETAATSLMPSDSSLPTASTPTLSAPEGEQGNHQSLLRSARRTSTRDKNKREVPLARTRVKYDMQLVPTVRRNVTFLKHFSSGWQPSTTSSSSSYEPPEKRRSSRFVSSLTQVYVSTDTVHNPSLEPPFVDDNTVVWVPTKRSEWEDTISEMTAVCTSAAMRRAMLQTHGDELKAPFQPPLSRDYIRDRIDIDDPLNGYQMRHRHGGWMQGFILYTTFTTWTYGFRWDSQNPLCGIDAETSNHFVDRDGSLAMELESLARSGDPGAGGIVFPAIAEIGLLGGLGCGEYLLRMALDDISAKSHYKYVILQATEQSRTFYERFGFVRVGAICQYGGGGNTNVNLRKPADSSDTATDHLPEVVGYRHWTHANESEKSLQMHGGPSYMMCFKLPDHADEIQPGAFFEAMLKLRVESKPRVEQLGPSTTPILRRSFSMPIEVSAGFEVGHPATAPPIESDGVDKKLTAKRGINAKLPRRKSFATFPIPVEHSANQSSVAPDYVPSPKTVAVVAAVKVSRKKASSKRESCSSAYIRPSKRPKVSDEPIVKKRGRPAAKSKVQQRMQVSAYVEKQYNSIWLAVSPLSSSTSPPRRPPPRSRDGIGELPTGKNRTQKLVKNGPRQDKLETGRGTRSQPVSSKKRSFNEISLSGEKDDDSRIVSKHGRCPVSLIESIMSGQTSPLVPMALRKQKVVSYPRNRVHFYNRVVRRKNEECTTREATGIESSNAFYFVLEYNEDKALLCLVPLTITGKLTGKRVGRPRYQCSVDGGIKSFIIDDAINYIVVPSAMIMKTPVVAQEAWDIATETDVDFLTR